MRLQITVHDRDVDFVIYDGPFVDCDFIPIIGDSVRWGTRNVEVKDTNIFLVSQGHLRISLLG